MAEQEEEERVPLLTSVAVACREVPRVAVERRVLRRIEGFLDGSQRCWFDAACGKSLALAKRVFARKGWSRELAVEGLCLAGRVGRLDVIQWLCATGEEVAGVRTSDLVTQQSFWSGSLVSVAATTGQSSLVQWLLQSGAPVDTKDPQGQTALHHAARYGHVSTVQLLLENGAHTNERDDRGQTALHLASGVNLRDHPMAKGLSVNGETAKGYHSAMERFLSVVQLLVDNGAQVNEKDGKGQTPLHLASSVWTRDASVVELLVKRGAQCFDVDGAGRTALHYAIVNSHFKAVEFFLTKCSGDDQPPLRDLWNALFAAARKNQGNIIKILAEELNVDMSIVSRRGRTALLEAVAACAKQSVKEVLTQGADVHQPDKFGVTPVMEACRQCDIDNLHTLLQNGGSVQDADLAGRTALHYAAEGGDKFDNFSAFLGGCVGYDAIIALLVEHGGDVNCVDKRQWTPLHFAAANYRIDGVNELLMSGANVTSQNLSSKTAAVLALEQGYTDVYTRLVGENLTAAAVHMLEENRLGADYAEYMLDRASIRYDSSRDGNEGFWLDSPIEVKPVEEWHPNNVFAELERWSKLNHPHVMKLYGFCLGNGSGAPLFIHERSAFPSLFSYLAQAKIDGKDGDLWSKLYEAALGLLYLHDRNIIHGDLNVDSVAVATNGAAKLRNLGSDTIPIRHRHYRNTTAAPEVISGLPPSFASDVYSFGITIIQAFALSYFPWKLTGEAHDRAVLSGMLPAKPSSMTSSEWQLVTRMCSLDPSSRPSASDVARQLQVFTRSCKILDRSCSSDNEDTIGGACIAEKLSCMSTMLAEVGEMCEGSNTIDMMNRSVYDRLMDTFSSLKKLREAEITQQFGDIVRYYHKRLRSTRSVGKALAARFAASRRDVDDTFTVHRELDSLMDRALLSRSSALHQWRDSWQRLRSQQQHEITEKMEDFPALFADVDDAVQREELLTYLRFELSNYPTYYVGNTKSNVSRTKATIASIATFRNEKWFIPAYDVEFDKFDEFSSGAFGSVHRGQWKHAEVVVKKLKLANGTDPDTNCGYSYDAKSLSASVHVRVSEEVQATFLNEVKIWHQLFHPHVVQLFGACHIGQPFFVCEYAGGGQLDQYLRDHFDEIWVKLHEAALGLRYLHVKRVVHGDLKCNNILIGSDGLAKLTDFGLSTLNTNEPENVEESDPQVGAIRWKAPEVLRGEKATFASDVYSFGMCILEAVSGKYPWGMTMDPVVKYYVLKEKRIPRRPQQCSEELYALVERMCRFDPTERADMNEVVETLKAFCCVRASSNTY